MKPFTPIGDGMLGTAGAVMPGGVLPPASGEDTKSELVSTGSNSYTEKTADMTAVTTTLKPSGNPINEKSSKVSDKESDGLPLVLYLEST